jgi:hypothetical protein
VGLTEDELADVYKRRYAGFRRGAAAIVGDNDLAHGLVQDAFANALSSAGVSAAGRPRHGSGGA